MKEQKRHTTGSRTRFLFPSDESSNKRPIRLRFLVAILACCCINVVMIHRSNTTFIQKSCEKIVSDGIVNRNNNNLPMLLSISTNSTLSSTTESLQQQQQQQQALVPSTIADCQQEYESWTLGRLPGLTREDLLRSRTYLGNRYRLAKFASKLRRATNYNETSKTYEQQQQQPDDEEEYETNFGDSDSENNNDSKTRGVHDGIPRIKAVVCGGSISLGHGVRTSYSNHLQTWLNDRFPVSDGSKKHKVLNKGFHGTDICAMAKRTNQLIQELGPDVDLFVLEFAVNDYQGQDHVTQIEDRMDTFFEGFEEIASCTESVLIKLLKHYPEAAILFLELRTAVLPRKSGALLHMGAAQHYQVPVVSYEQALWPDYMELLEAIRPHRYTAPQNDTLLPFPHGCHACDFDGMEDDELREEGCRSVCDFQTWSEPLLDCSHPPAGRLPCYVPFLAHDEVHPSGIGHKIAADLIIDTIATANLDLCYQEQEKERTQQREQPPKQRQHNEHEAGVTVTQQQQQQQELEPFDNRNITTDYQQQSSTGKQIRKTLLEKKATMPRVGWMANNPLVLDAQTNFLWVNDTYLMFVEQHDLVPSFHTSGFQLLEDRFERWGWIATNEAGNESIAFEIDLPTLVPDVDVTNSERLRNGCYIPYLSVLKSYENMGRMTVRVYDNLKDREFVTEIDSLWEPRISIPHDLQLIANGETYYEEDDGCSGNCTVTITSHPMVEGRSGNKVKIITFSVRPCVRKEWVH